MFDWLFGRDKELENAAKGFRERQDKNAIEMQKYKADNVTLMSQIAVLHAHVASHKQDNEEANKKIAILELKVEDLTSLCNSRGERLRSSDLFRYRLQQELKELKSKSKKKLTKKFKKAKV